MYPIGGASVDFVPCRCVASELVGRLTRRAFPSLGLGAVVLLVAAPGAPALTMMRLPTPGLSPFPSKVTLVGGPLFAGSAVFWAEGPGSAYGDTSDQGPLSVVVANRAGQRGAALTLPTVGPGRSQRLTSLAASPTRLAAVRVDSPDDNGGGSVSETYIRAPDGVHQVERVTGSGRAINQVAVDGDTVALGGGCGPDAISLSNAPDGTPGEHVPLAASSCVKGLKLAGRYLAYTIVNIEPAQPPDYRARNSERLVVWDRQAGREAYSFSLPDLVGAPDFKPLESTDALDFDLKADGTLAVGINTLQRKAVTYPTGGAFGGPISSPEFVSHLFWFSPSQPYPHTVPVEMWGPYISMSGGLIALRRFSPHEDVVIDLEANVIDRFDRLDTPSRPAPIAFDGSELAWFTRAGKPPSAFIARDTFPTTPPAIGPPALEVGRQAAVRFRLSQPASVVVKIYRCARGRRGRSCRGAHRIGSLTGRGRVGVNRLRLAAKTRRELAHRGVYSVAVRARNQAGRSTGAQRLLVRTG